MAKVEKTTKKLPKNPFTGAEGNSFAADNQPSPEAKRLGWEELRKRRLLTQGIIKELINDDGTPKDSFVSYFRALIDNAKMGNAKSIETVNKAIEDEVIKVAQTDTAGNDLPKSDLTKLTDAELRLIAELQSKSRIS